MYLKTYKTILLKIRLKWKILKSKYIFYFKQKISQNFQFGKKVQIHLHNIKVMCSLKLCKHMHQSSVSEWVWLWPWLHLIWHTWPILQAAEHSDVNVDHWQVQQQCTRMSMGGPCLMGGLLPFPLGSRTQVSGWWCWLWEPSAAKHLGGTCLVCDLLSSLLELYLVMALVHSDMGILGQPSQQDEMINCLDMCWAPAECVVYLCIHSFAFHKHHESIVK